MPKRRDVQKTTDPCYGCMYYHQRQGDKNGHCGVTGFFISDQLLKLCNLAGWKRTRWTKGTSKRKLPHYPPAQ